MEYSQQTSSSVAESPRPFIRGEQPACCASGDGCPWHGPTGERAGTHAAAVRLARMTFGHTRCRPRSDERGPERVLGANVITFPRSGVFVMEMAGESFVADPSRVLFCNRGAAFRTSHPGALGDETDWLSVHDDLLLSIIRDSAAAAGVRGWASDHPDRPFVRPYAALGPRECLAARSLFAYVRRSEEADPLQVEEQSLRLIGRVIAAGQGGAARQATVGGVIADAGPRVLQHARLVDGVRSILAVRYRERLTIASLARELGCSPFHLCRVYRRLTSMPIHRSLNSLRLRAALERLEGGGISLSDIAEHVGFCSHSHFSDAFRREFGMTPSSARRLMKTGGFTEAA